MSHNVENMFSVKETPWHGLGSVIHDAPNVTEGIRLAGLDWNVEVVSMFRERTEKVTAEDGTETSKVVHDNLDDYGKAFVRSTDKTVLGIVGPNTHPLQNAKAFDFFQPFIDSKEATLETAGSLSEGRKVWVMAKLARDNEVIVKGDEVAKFVLLSNSHDGTTAVKVGFTPIRVVCANTLAMAHNATASKLLRVRHSSKVEKNLEKIREIVDLANAEFVATAEQFRLLASRQINYADLKKYVKVVLDMDEDDDKNPKRTMGILQTIIDRHETDTNMVAEATRAMKGATLEAVIKNFEGGLGTDNKASRGTYWTAYNAFNEYLNYDKGRTSDTRMNSLWFGDSQRANAKALEAALELATAA